jgi:DNA polymerase-4
MSAPDRTILHVDMDAFFASVEQLDHPEWRGKPVIVGAPPDRRGVVCAASYEARKYGVHSAMPSRTAGRLCPDGIFVSPNGARYAEASAQIFEVFGRFTPWVEGLSVDEAFLDVTGVRGLFGEGVEVGATIKRTIRSETGLTASVGVAPNKFLAKVASDLEKPDGLTVVPFVPEAIARFLAPLPIARIWGVGKVMQGVLQQWGWSLIGDIQRASREQLNQALGDAAAAHLHALAWGRDDRPVITEREEKSHSREHTFEMDCSDLARVEQVLSDLCEEVGCALRATGRMARVIRLKIRWRGFETLSRQERQSQPFCDDFTIREVAVKLLRREGLAKPIRLIGVGVSSLGGREHAQLDLFDGTVERQERRERLSSSIDHLRERFGKESVILGSGTFPDEESTPG